MIVATLTDELGALVADATGLPTSIDPVRPPAVPGCFVGPASLTPDTETGGRLIVAQWEVGALVPADLGAWAAAATHGEHIAAAIIAHATLGLVDGRSMLYPTGDGGELPGYRIDVAVLLHADALEPAMPSGKATLVALAALTATGIAVAIAVVDGAATMTAPALLTAAGAAVAVNVIDGAATLTAPAAMTAAGTVLAVVIIDGAATLTAPATMTAAGIVAPAGPWTPAALPLLRGWFDASDAATLTASAGRVSQWADKSGGARHLVQPSGSGQPSLSPAEVNGRNALYFNGAFSMENGAWGMTGTTGTVIAVIKNYTPATVNNRYVAMAAAAPGNDYAPVEAAAWLLEAPANGTYYANANVLTTPTPFPTTTATVVTTKRNGAAWTQYRNGAQSATGTGAVGSFAATRFTVASSPGGGSYINGFICEVIVTDGALSDADRTDAENYLRTKWGTP